MPTASSPKLTVILPARDEEANIGDAVESLAAQTVPVEIIVVNDDSTDRTGEILSGLAERFPRLRLVESGGVAPGWVGKNRAAHLGAEQARTPWLLFTDADVRHAPAAVETGLRLAREADAALVSFSPEQEMRTWWERAVIPFVYCRLAKEYRYQRVNDANDLAAAANGQWLLVSREAYRAVGGHEAVKGEILEDVALATRLKRAGYWLHFGPGAGVARARMYRSMAEMREGWSKNLYPLLGYRKRTVLAAIAGGSPDLLALVVLLWSFLDVVRSGSWPLWLGVASGTFLALRHVGYGLRLRRNHFPLSCIWYYVVGSVGFALLGAESLARYAGIRRVRWKGRDYTVSTK